MKADTPICDAPLLESYKDLSDQQVKDTFESATGIECTSLEHGCPNDEVCKSWGAPYIHKDSCGATGCGATCWKGSVAAGCARVPVDGNHRVCITWTRLVP